MARPPLIATLTLNPSLDEVYTVQRLDPHDLNRAEAMQRYPGGKGINVARVVHELGGATRAHGFAGGRDGQWLADAMDRLGVPHRFTRIDGTTRNNVKIVVCRPHREFQINTPGPRIAIAELRRLLRDMRVSDPSPAWWVFSGSVPPGVPPAIYRQLVAWAHQQRIPCVLDADGPALRAGLLAHPTCIKPNRAEAERLLGRRLRSLEAVGRAAHALARRGIEHVIISLGRAGAVLAARSTNDVWLARSPVVRVRSTIGAGDALVGGFLLALARGAAATEAFRHGVACGAACVMTSGTELCHRADVRRLLPRVRVRRLPV